VTTALLCGAGYIIAISSVLAICGGYLSMVLQYYFNVDIPWVYFSVVFTAGAMYMMFRGVAVSTKLAGLFFGFEMLVLIVVSVAAIIKNGGHLSAVPFEPSHITNGFSGLAAGFPLAIYLFIGWENSAALAEETGNPRRNVPRAVFLSIALMVAGYVLYAYATATDFKYSVTALGTAAIPFINVSHDIAAWLSFFAWMAGITSTLGVLISAVNSQARLIFNAGREGLLPRWLGKVHPTRRTPVNAMFTFVAIAALIIAVWAILHLAGGSKQSGGMSALNFFVESSTMGTILVLVVYFLSNLALPFYYRKFRPQEFNVVKHAVLPVLGMIAIGVPVYYLCKPGQPSPFDWFPYAALGVIVVSVIYAFYASRRDPGLGERVGSIVADE
jgi:amino acid transporter